LRERGKDGEREEGKPTQASNSKTAYDCPLTAGNDYQEFNYVTP